MSDSWKKVGGFSRTGTQNYVRNNDATMGGTTFTSTDVSRNPLNPLNPYSSMTKIGDNAGIIYINGDIDMTGGADKNAPINRIKNVRDPSNNQDVATKHYVDKKLDVIISQSGSGFTGSTGPHGIGLKGEVGAQGRIGPTGSTGPKGDKGEVTTEKGAKGDQGPPGATGSTGAQGRTGPVGPAGPAGDVGSQGVQGNQGSNGQILWLNIDGIDVSNTLLNDQFLISTGAIYSGKKTVGPISVSATYGNTNFVYPAARFQNLASELTPLSVIPSGVWTVHIYANVPQTSDANQIEMYGALFLVNGTDKQPLPDGLIFETEEGGDVTYLPPREQFLPSHVKYIAKSWTWLIDGNPNLSSSGIPIISTVTKRYTIEMPIEFISLQQNAKNLYVQLQIYFRNTKTTNQAANARLYFQTDFDSSGNTTYSYIQSTLGVKGVQGIKGDIGATGSSGPEGPKGSAGAQGIQGVAGPTGSTGMKGDSGYRGPTGPTGPRGYANSQGPQYSIQYRSDSRTDISGGDFSGNNYFKYLPSGTAAADPSGGTLVLKDISCDSIHSPFYVTNELNTDSAAVPRTFITGGDISNGSYSPFISTGINSNNNKSIPSSHSNIATGIKFIHNSSVGELQINMHTASTTTAKTGLKIDGGANIYAGQDKFVVSYDSGSVGVGGVSINELNTNTNLVRKLHVKGVTMIGDNPGSLVGTGAEANMLLNGPKSAPIATSYPGIYNRNIPTLVERNTLNLTSDYSNGLGIISPQFITFQTGNPGTQNNSIVINSAGDVSVLGKTNLNGPLAINKNFVGVEANGTLNYAITPNIDISGTMFIRSTNPNSASEKQKIRLISSTVTNGMTIPSVSDNRQINEITGVGVSTGGFLRLTAESATKSCIDLIGATTGAEPQQNSVRIHTNSIERVFIDGTGKIGLHTSAPTVPLEVTGNVKCNTGLNMSTTKITSLASCTTSTDAANKGYVDTSMPIGAIIMWSPQSTATLPTNWKICDGTSYNGIVTPDLRGRFVLSSGSGSGLTDRTSNTTGGEETHQLSEYEMPQHNHNVLAYTGDVYGNAIDGGHAHTYTDPMHSHRNNVIPGVNGDAMGTNNYQPLQNGSFVSTHNTVQASIGITILSNENAYGSNSTGTRHNHTIRVTQEYKGSSGSHNNMPPYYVLAFYMRVT